MSSRIASLARQTAETKVELTLNLDGSGLASIASGVGFYDHLLTSLTRHAHFDLSLQCQGDLEIDDHHTVEDCALSLGAAMDQALGDRRGIQRFGSAYAPLDEALSRAVVDLSGRPYAVVSLGLQRDAIGAIACENIEHAVRSLAVASRSCIHLQLLSGDNDHHRAESAFKALALALREAVALDGSCRIPSTKETLL